MYHEPLVTRKVASPIRVVAAVIERDGKYLITQRRATAVLAGLWEFPGGKVEPGETDEAALRREVQERLGVNVSVRDRIASRRHDYEGYSVDLNLYQADRRRTRNRRSLRVADFRWVASERVREVSLPRRRPGHHRSGCWASRDGSRI